MAAHAKLSCLELERARTTIATLGTNLAVLRRLVPSVLPEHT